MLHEQKCWAAFLFGLEAKRFQDHMAGNIFVKVDKGGRSNHQHPTKSNAQTCSFWWFLQQATVERASHFPVKQPGHPLCQVLKSCLMNFSRYQNQSIRYQMPMGSKWWSCSSALAQKLEQTYLAHCLPYAKNRSSNNNAQHLVFAPAPTKRRSGFRGLPGVLDTRTSRDTFNGEGSLSILLFMRPGVCIQANYLLFRMGLKLEDQRLLAPILCVVQ